MLRPLTHQQIKTLKLIHRKKLTSENFEKFSGSTLEHLPVLKDYGYISYSECPVLVDGHFITNIQFSITTDGEVYLEEKWRSFLRVTLPDIISWVLSILALAAAIFH